jgi:hypothetical protein
VLTVDGVAVPVRVTGTVADAVARRPLGVAPCGPPLTLAAGRHDVRTAVGRDLGLDVDRLVLDSAASAAAAGAAARPTPPAVTVTNQTRVAYDLRVDGATAPFWLVLGQSHNDGWHARLDGHDLGAPTLVDGYANGWRITPPAGGGPLVVTLTWTPQRLVWVGLGLSAVAVVACGMLLVVDRRRVPEPVARPEPRRRPPPVALVVGVTVGFALVAGPAGAAAAAVTAVAATWAPPRVRQWLPALPAVLLAGVTAYVVAKTIRYPIPPDLNWPAAFSAVDPLAWAAVAAAITLVVVGPGNCVSGPVTR